MPAAEAAAPVQYAWWVLALGVILVVAALAWLAWALLRRTEDPQPEAPGLSWGGRVDALYGQFSRGELDLRALHLALAQLVRELGSERTGRDLSWMSRAEVLASFPRTGLGPLLARFEQPSFSFDPREEAETSVRLTKEVIARW